MTAPPEPQDSQSRCETASVVLSQKQRRAILKRERRKRKRQAIAKLKEAALDHSQSEEHQIEDEEEQTADEQSERLHQEWLERERIAQEEFRLKKEREEEARKRKEEEERRIREEWEEQQRKEKEELEQKEQKKREREEAVQKMLDQAESQLENGVPWKNPDAPKDYGTEKDKANCPFFLKTGSCRFGDRCSRKHDHPTSSTTLMVRGMFVVFGMEQSRRDDYDTDASLEYSEEEMHQQFLDFYEDALPEFKNAGRVVQFKVSCNYEPHLRGNVYVQYDTEEKCREAFMMFNGRWYAGRQLQCEFSPVTRWKTAICGLFDRRKCPKGKHCNFLHVYRNPDNEFWEADRDLHMSPDRSGGYSSRHFGSRDGVRSQRSPERISQRRWTDRRSHSRERYSYRGRQSRERRGCSRERRSQSSERRGHSRERRSCSQESRGHSQERRGHSRERRSRSRGRHSRNGEKRSCSRSREKRKSEQSMTRRSMSQREQSRRSRSRSHSRDRLKQGECTSADSRRETSKSNSPKRVSKNRSVKRKSHRMESQSPENSDRMDAHHHKHSKKSKKKKKGKKKHKRKKSKSRSSSSESDKDSRNEECDEKPAKSEERTAVASSTGSPADGVDTTDLEGCHPEEEIHCALTNANKSDGITQSG